MSRFVQCNSRLPRNTPRKTKTRATRHGQQYDGGKKERPPLLDLVLARSRRQGACLMAQLTGGGLLAGFAGSRSCGLLRCSGAVQWPTVPFLGSLINGVVVVVGLGLGVRAQGYGFGPGLVPGPPVITTIDVVKTETGDLFPRSKGSSVQPCKVSNSPGAHPYPRHYDCTDPLFVDKSHAGAASWHGFHFHVFA